MNIIIKIRPYLSAVTFAAFITATLPSVPALAASADDRSQYNYNEIPIADEGPKDLFDAMTRRNNELNEREERLREEESNLEKLKLEIEERLRAVETANAKLNEILENMRKLDQKQISDLAKVYENMPPEEGAKRITEVEPELAVRILKKMKSRKSGRMLAFVAPDRAAILSEGFGQSIIPGEDLTK